MAMTYTVRTATANGVALASNKSMLAITNTSATAIVRVYRIWVLNLQTVATTTPPWTELMVQRVTVGGAITSTLLTPVVHDTTSTTTANLASAGVLCHTNATTNVTPVTNSIYRRVMPSIDEPATTALTPDELWCFPAIGEIWNAGYKDSNVEPITLRQNEGVEVRQPGSNVVGLLQLCMTFTYTA